MMHSRFDFAGADVVVVGASRAGIGAAIARAFRWRDMLESGEYATIREIAAAENINESYVGRVMRLTLLAPDLVEVILDGRQPVSLQLEALMRRFPPNWGEQYNIFDTKVAGKF